MSKKRRIRKTKQNEDLFKKPSVWKRLSDCVKGAFSKVKAKADRIGFHPGKKGLIVVLTVLALLAVFLIRAGYLCASYPEQKISMVNLTGESGENCTGLSVEEGLMRATENGTNITYTFAEPVPVYEITWKTSNLSRTNCRSYIKLIDTDIEGSTIMAAGSNAITFEGVTPSTTASGLSITPVTLRGVSFTWYDFVVNPHSAFIAGSMSSFAVAAAVAVLLELLLFALVRNVHFAAEGNGLRGKKKAGEEKSKKGAKGPVVLSVIIFSLQIFYTVFLAHLALTSDWESYTRTYQLLCYVLESVFILLVLSHVGEKRSDLTSADHRGAWELPILRIFLLSFIDFSMVEMLYSDQFYLDNAASIIGNLLIYALPYVVMYLITPGKAFRRFSYALPHAIWLGVAIANHYYFEFRGQALELADFSGASTAKNVLSDYSFAPSSEMIVVCTASFILFLVILQENERTFRKKNVVREGISAAALIFLLCYIPMNAPTVNLWNTNIGTKHHGYVLSFVSFAQKSLEKPTPEGYTADAATSILDSYADSDVSLLSEAPDTADPAVNVIVIMNEAFSDLPTTYGFETDTDCMPYIHSLSGSNVKKGKMIVSVFGGTTADTEYEFLTGNSISFLNSGAIPYSQYIDSEQESLAWYMKDAGYEVSAFHPYLSNGYRRNVVYPYLGFDRFIAKDTGTLPYTSRLRSYVDDESDFKDVIYYYEHQNSLDSLAAGESASSETSTGSPFFLFNVTMQNHGGYNSEVPAVDVTVKPTDENLASFSQLQEYLSLVKETDSAFEQLTDYFSKVKEKTIILMFGDHQPGMDEDVYEAMNPDMYADDATVEEKLKKYTVPYIMWANYDLPEGDLPVTSPNFLHAFLLENAGLPLTTYDKLCESVCQQYPALSANGFLDSDGNAHDVSELDSVDLLEDYKFAAYYNLFDKDFDWNYYLKQ